VPTCFNQTTSHPRTRSLQSPSWGSQTSHVLLALKPEVGLDEWKNIERNPCPLPGIELPFLCFCVCCEISQKTEAFLGSDFISRSIYCLILDFPCQKMTLSIKRKMKEVGWEVGRALSTGAVHQKEMFKESRLEVHDSLTEWHGTWKSAGNNRWWIWVSALHFTFIS